MAAFSLGPQVCSRCRAGRTAVLCPREQETGRRAGGAKDRSNSGLTPKRVSTPKHLSFCEGHVQGLTYQEGTTCGPQGLWLCCHLAAEEQVGSGFSAPLVISKSAGSLTRKMKRWQGPGRGGYHLSQRPGLQRARRPRYPRGSQGPGGGFLGPPAYGAGLAGRPL